MQCHRACLTPCPLPGAAPSRWGRQIPEPPLSLLPVPPCPCLAGPLGAGSNLGWEVQLFAVTVADVLASPLCSPVHVWMLPGAGLTVPAPT